MRHLVESAERLNDAGKYDIKKQRFHLMPLTLNRLLPLRENAHRLHLMPS